MEGYEIHEQHIISGNREYWIVFGELPNPKVMTEMTYEEFKEMLDDVARKLQNQKPNKFLIVRGCKTYGLMQGTPGELPVCEDPECNGCVSLKQALENYE